MVSWCLPQLQTPRPDHSKQKSAEQRGKKEALHTVTKKKLKGWLLAPRRNSGSWSCEADRLHLRLGGLSSHPPLRGHQQGRKTAGQRLLRLMLLWSSETSVAQTERLWGQRGTLFSPLLNHFLCQHLYTWTQTRSVYSLSQQRESGLFKPRDWWTFYFERLRTTKRGGQAKRGGWDRVQSAKKRLVHGGDTQFLLMDEVLFLFFFFLNVHWRSNLENSTQFPKGQGHCVVLCEIILTGVK